MRLAIPAFLCSLFAFALAVNLEDKSNIEDITAAFNLLFDEKKISELGKVLTLDVTYDAGAGPVQGLPATIDVLQKIISSTATTYFTLGTQVIKFLPPFGKDKRSNFAESVSYSNLVIFGSGNLTGEFFIGTGIYVDKEIVRTKEPGFGGWRFKNRKVEPVVSFPTRYSCLISSNPTQLVGPKSITSMLILAFSRENLSETPPL